MLMYMIGSQTHHQEPSLYKTAIMPYVTPCSLTLLPPSSSLSNHSSIMMMKAAGFSKMSLHVTEDTQLHSQRHENIKFLSVLTNWSTAKSEERNTTWRFLRNPAVSVTDSHQKCALSTQVAYKILEDGGGRLHRNVARKQGVTSQIRLSAYSAGTTTDISEKLKRNKAKIYFRSSDETASACTWHSMCHHDRQQAVWQLHSTAD
jgi:hypothetical protein